MVQDSPIAPQLVPEIVRTNVGLQSAATCRCDACDGDFRACTRKQRRLDLGYLFALALYRKMGNVSLHCSHVNQHRRSRGLTPFLLTRCLFCRRKCPIEFNGLKIAVVATTYSPQSLTMLLNVNVLLSHVLPLMVLTLFSTRTFCDRGVRNQSPSNRRRTLPSKKQKGLERSMTLVTDTLEDAGTAVFCGRDILRPGHSFLVFGATAEEGALRVELVSPTIDGLPYGLAISVTELASSREDVGDLQFPMPAGTKRSNMLLERTTKLRNAQIFNPFLEPDTDTVMSPDQSFPILEIALRHFSRTHDPLMSVSYKYGWNSHTFVEELARRPDFGTPGGGPVRVLGNENIWARFAGACWALLQLDRLEVDPSDIMKPLRDLIKARIPLDVKGARPVRRPGAATPIYHIFYEARAPRSSLLGDPSHSTVSAMFELFYTEGNLERQYGARKIKNPWKGLISALNLPTSHHSQPIVRLSRNPLLTSAALSSNEIGYLPSLLTSQERPLTQVVRPAPIWLPLSAAPAPSPSSNSVPQPTTNPPTESTTSAVTESTTSVATQPTTSAVIGSTTSVVSQQPMPAG